MKKKYKILIGVVVTLIVIRIFLPRIVLHFANKALANMDGYYGHIEDIDLHLFRGAYIINDIYIHRVDSVTQEQTPFFDCEKIDLSVEWSALFDGAIVGELEFERPGLYFTRDKAEPADVAADTTNFRKILKDLMPLRVNRFAVYDGSIRYIDSTASPAVNIAMENVEIEALNLTNSSSDTARLPSTVNASADVYGGTLALLIHLNILTKQPTFDLNAEFENVDLPQLNPFMQAYGNFDINRGTFGLYTEMAAKDGQFVGYIKPLIKDLDVVGREDRENSLLTKAWEGLVGTVAEVFENQPKDQLASKVELQGDFQNPDIQIAGAIWEVLRNAFIQALLPRIDYEIDLETVDYGTDEKEGFFKRVFH